MHSSRAQSKRDQSTKNLDSRREGRERERERKKKIENSLTKLPVHRSEMPRKGGVC